MILMPLAEIIDRLTIVKLKVERIHTEDKTNEYEYYNNALKQYEASGVIINPNWLEQLYNINKQIWDLEFDIRNGKEGLLGLEEVGRRAIKIREINKMRVSVKNEIVEQTGTGFKDIKMNHTSE